MPFTRLPRLSAATLPRPQLYLIHPRSSRMTPISPAALRTQKRANSTAAQEHKEASGGHDDHGDHHESHYDPPGGWLWGIRPGEKYEKEGWEFLAYYGFWGSFVVGGIAYAFKEDTSIQTWALEEARRRLEKEGILEDPNPDWKPLAESE